MLAAMQSSQASPIHLTMNTNEPQTCNTNHPKPKGAPGKWEHERVITYHLDNGSFVRCIVCGEQWDVEDEE